MVTFLVVIVGVSLFASVASIEMCEDGQQLNVTSNTCQNLQCPDQNSTETYPDCTCTHKNFDYNKNLNLCFRVCPENSTGYWPECICDEDGFFHKQQFKCISCPAGTGITGKYPNCDCGEGGIYIEFLNSCQKCAYNSVGVFPNCTCNDGDAIFDAEVNVCYATQEISSDEYDLNDNDDYSNNNDNSITESIVNDECPLESVGAYPNCVCDDDGTYNETLNNCFKCPAQSSGKYPNCNCTNGVFYEFYLEVACIKCPLDATGVYPYCECSKGNIFSAYINECYAPCPTNMIFKPFPNCQCEYDYYYDDNESLCKSNVGRKCPIDSIGIGPECLCIREKDKFNSWAWECLEPYDYLPPPPPFSSHACPGSGKYPQCPDAISPLILKSLAG